MVAYKICILDLNGLIHKIFVYENYKVYKNDDDRYQSIFSEKEREHIQNEKIPIVFSKQQIHKDDSIRIVKKKIMEDLDTISYDELYLFSSIQHKIILQNVFQNVAIDNTIHVNEFKQLLVNLGISGNVLKSIPQKEYYEYDDLYKINLDGKSSPHKIPLGKEFTIKRNELFSANPYDILPNMKLELGNNFLKTEDNLVLLNQSGGDFIDNIIYVCLAQDVMKYAAENTLNLEYMMTMYFPLLANRNVFSVKELTDIQNVLKKETKKIMNKQIFNMYKSVDLLYDIYNARTSELPYLTHGIDSFEITIMPGMKQLLPLDAIFKNVHSSESIPFIKYNPGARRENIYRLYTEKITKFGDKIPFLEKNVVMKLATDIGKNNQISLFIKSEHQLYIDILSNGSLNVYGNLTKPLLPPQLTEIIDKYVNPVIQHINDFLEKNGGYSIQPFHSLEDSFIQIVNLHYVCSIKTTKAIKLGEYTGCIGSVFDIVDDNIDKGATLRFKRVDNYQEMNAEDVFIAEQFEHRKKDREIVDEIVEKFDMTLDQAKMRLVKYYTDHETRQQKIKDSPGFPVQFRIATYDIIFFAEVDILHSIKYVDVLHVYIDSLLRITQFPETTKINKTKFVNMSSKKINENIDKSHIGNVVVVQTENILQKIQSPIEEEFDEDKDDYFMREEFDEEEEEQEKKLENPEITSKNKTNLGDLTEYEDATIEDEDIEILQEEDSPILSQIDKNAISDIDENEDDDENNIMFDPMYDFEEDDDIVGGDNENNEYNSAKAKQIDGMPLRHENNNLFLKRMKERDPSLFLTEPQGNFKSYARLCPVSRQPVIITEKERSEMDPASYNHHIEYGTDPDNKYSYICPRYWCLLNQKAMTEEQVKNNECGGKIIPKNAVNVPKGHYIFENKQNAETIPSFLKDGKHPNGHCLPCCFKKNWESEKIQDRIKQCASNVKKNAAEVDPKKRRTDLILSIERYPIPPRRFGFLPMSVQLFLQTDNSKSLDPNNSALLRINTKTILRYGVEESMNKSFIACISDLYSKKKKINPSLSILEMTKIMISAITIDVFLKIHNGSLVAMFKPKTYAYEDIDFTKYDDSEFLESINLEIESQEDFANDTIAAYEQFLVFLEKEDSIIDHTYLWDIVCSPNPKLFSLGLNLAILNIKENDMTDDIELLCPTSSYSDMIYDSKKETVILLKHDEFYEPIYLLDKNETKPEIYITFYEKLANKTQNVMNQTILHKTLQIIKNTSHKYCASQPSMPSVYKFKHNKSATTILEELTIQKYSILFQVLNYKNKIIGIGCSIEKDKTIIVPCFPSSRLSDLPIKYMDDDIWTNYEYTRDTLIKINKTTKGSILCKPMIKVIEDGLIVGILTETNQFVMVSPPYDNIQEDGLVVIQDENHIVADKVITTDKKEDGQRIRAVKMIALESQFYTVFRTTVRIAMNEFANREFKDKIKEIIENHKYLYKNKLKKIEKLLHELCDTYVVFNVFDDAALMSLDDITNCRTENKTKTKYCLFKNGTNQLIIPKKHLLSGLENNKVYFERVADELVRYKRIRSFILNPNVFLNLSNTEYKINENEMIMLDSFLTPDYFKELKEHTYIQNMRITYDMANPVKTQSYKNEISYAEQLQLTEKEKEIGERPNIMEIECFKEQIDFIGNINTNEWNKMFPKNAKEWEMNSSKKCSFFTFIYLLFKKYEKMVTIEAVKDTLIIGYKKYMERWGDKILKILKKQGKKDIIDKVISKKITLEEGILNQDYCLTNLDMWVLAIETKIPMVLFSTKPIKNLFENLNYIILYTGKTNDKYYFVRTLTEPQGKTNFIPEYNIVSTPFMLSELKGFQELDPMGKMSLEKYLENV